MKPVGNAIIINALRTDSTGATADGPARVIYFITLLLLLRLLLLKKIIIITIIRAHTVFVLRSKAYYVDYRRRRRRRHTATARSLLHTPLPSSTKKKLASGQRLYTNGGRMSLVAVGRFFPFYSSPTVYIICVHNRYDNEYR